MRAVGLRALVPFAMVLALHTAALPVLAQPRPSDAAPSRDLVERGRALFDDQRYEESIQTLSGALVRPANTTAQKIEIDRLLALGHITLGHNEEAENFVRALLALQPDYQLPASESPRFRDFFAAARARWEKDGRPGLAADAPPAKPVTLKHTSPSEATADIEVPLTASLEDPGHRAKTVQLFFRTGSHGQFASVPAQYTPDDSGQGGVRATIPGSAVRAPYVAYYLLVSDGAGLPLAASGDADAPLRIPVTEAARAWVLPVAIGGVVVGVAGLALGSLALAGVFKGGGSGSAPARGMSTVSIGVMSFR